MCIRDRLRVAQRLSVDKLGIGLDSCLEVLRILGIDEGRRDTEAGQRDAQEIIRTAVDAGGGDDMIPRTQQREDGRGDGAHPAGGSDRPDPAVDGCQALLQHVGRGIVEARIEVAGLGEIEDTGRMVAALEGEGIALIDGYGGSAEVLGGFEPCV